MWAAGSRDSRHVIGETSETSMDIFLSYSHHDEDFVSQLISDCEQYGIEIWVDKKRLLVGDSIISKVQEAIDRALLVVVVLSQNSLISGWVKRELEQAYSAEIEGRTIVMPIVLGPEVSLPGLIRPKLYADFSGWPQDKEQYNYSLKLLLHSIITHKKERAALASSADVSKTLPIDSHHQQFFSGALLRQLSLSHVGEWPLGKVFKGTFPIKRGYIDGADRVWRVSRQSIKMVTGNSQKLKIRDNRAGRFLGEDDQGRPWCLISHELFVFLEDRWIGLPLPGVADSARVNLWRFPPEGVVGPVAPLKDGVSILSASDWRWRVLASPIGTPQASSGSGGCLLIANTDSWALTRSPEQAWDMVVRFTAKVPKPLSLLAQTGSNGFWMHCADHTLFWVRTDIPRLAPIALGIKQGLPGARADIVIMRQEGEVWCAGSGGVAFTTPGATNQFTVLTNQTPQLMWADGAGRVWAVFNHDIWCWVEQEDM